MALNRDKGKFGLNSIYDKVLKSDRVGPLHQMRLTSVHSLVQIILANQNQEKSQRLISGIALKKMVIKEHIVISFVNKLLFLIVLL